AAPRPEGLRAPESAAAAAPAENTTGTAAGQVPVGEAAPNTGGQDSAGQGDRSGQSGGDGTAGAFTGTGKSTPAESSAGAFPQVGAPAETAAPAAPHTAGLAGVTGPQATAPAAPTTDAQAAAPQAPATPAPAAAQVATRLVPLRLDADGVHRLTVNLHPADLGPVQVVAEIRNGDITVQLSGGTEAGTEALRSSLDDLRRELENSGFGNCTLDLRQGNAQQQARQQFAETPGRRADGQRGGPDVGAEPAPVATRRVGPGTGRLDVQA
ncbi:flagellar hook-length control protein FliK, partial [Actinoplanes sp. NPDC026670]|uniref:flagellar hook-length control protein FliK n=1 Tax=Actinoplanes sp. NPDC026670 TaxID=3154700 RepID=UPI0033D4CB73